MAVNLSGERGDGLNGTHIPVGARLGGKAAKVKAGHAILIPPRFSLQPIGFLDTGVGACSQAGTAPDEMPIVLHLETTVRTHGVDRYIGIRLSCLCPYPPGHSIEQCTSLSVVTTLDQTLV